jgi:hypothetical protein
VGSWCFSILIFAEAGNAHKSTDTIKPSILNIINSFLFIE